MTGRGEIVNYYLAHVSIYFLDHHLVYKQGCVKKRYYGHYLIFGFKIVRTLNKSNFFPHQKIVTEKNLQIFFYTFPKYALLMLARQNITITIQKHQQTPNWVWYTTGLFCSPEGVESLERAWWRGLLMPCLILRPVGPLPTLQADPDSWGRCEVERPGLWDLQLTRFLTTFPTNSQKLVWVY